MPPEAETASREDREEAASLSARTAKSAGWTVGWRLVTRNLGLLSTLVLVRLLSPADFGLVALATGFVGMVDALSMLGPQDVIIREIAPDRDLYDTAFTMNFMRGLATAVIVAGAAWPVAAFFSEPRLTAVLLALAAGTLFAACENIGIVDFRRELAFHREFLLQVVARVTGVVLTILFAVLWRNYWAIIIGILSTSLVRVVQSYTMSPYRPRLTLRRWRRILGFSLWVWASGLVMMVWDKIDSIVVGRFLGAGAVGIFAIGWEIGALPLTELVAPLHRALFSGFSAANRSGRGAEQAYLRVLALTMLLTLPAGVGISLVADPLVRLALGEKWLHAVPLIEILACASAILAPAYVAGALFIAEGKPYLNFYLGALATGAKIPLFVGLVLILGLKGGALAAALAIAAQQLLYLITMSRRTGGGFGEFLSAIWRPLVATAAMAALLAACGLGWTQGPAGAAGAARTLMIACPSGAVVYAATVFGIWFAQGRPEGAEQGKIEVEIAGLEDGEAIGEQADEPRRRSEQRRSENRRDLVSKDQATDKIAVPVGLPGGLFARPIDEAVERAQRIGEGQRRRRHQGRIMVATAIPHRIAPHREAAAGRYHRQRDHGEQRHDDGEQGRRDEGKARRQRHEQQVGMHRAHRRRAEPVRDRRIERGQPERHPDGEGEHAETEQANRDDHAGGRRRRTAPGGATEQPDTDQLDEGGKRHRRGQRKAGAGQRQDQAVAERGQVKPLKNGFKNIPLADESGLRRHRRQAHRRKQGADAEKGRSPPQQIRVNDPIAPARPEHPVRRQEQTALGERVGGHVKKRHGPGEACEGGKIVAAEDEPRPDRRERDRGVLGGGKGEQPAPVFLLEGIEGAEDRARYRQHDDENAQPACRRRPCEQGAAEGKKGGVEDGTREQGSRRAAAGGIGGREPFVERQQAELCAEPEDEQNAAQDPHRRRQHRRRLRKLSEGQALRLCREKNEGEQQRDAADFKQRQHEQYGAAARRRPILGQQHDGAAEAHELPGDQKGGRIVQSEHAERPDQAERRAEEPAGPACGRRAAKPAGEQRRGEAKAHQPQRVRREAEPNRLAEQARRQGHGGGPVRQRGERGGDAGDDAGRQQQPRDDHAPPGHGDERGRRPERDGGA